MILRSQQSPTISSQCERGPVVWLGIFYAMQQIKLGQL
jgi:hypothetical protein